MADKVYEFTCGHKATETVITTKIRRACPVCREGQFYRLHKICAHCGGPFDVKPSSHQQKYCARCADRRIRANSYVNKTTNREYIPLHQIDVDAVMDSRDPVNHDPLDIVFKKYEADPFYRPAPAQ